MTNRFQSTSSPKIGLLSLGKLSTAGLNGFFVDRLEQGHLDGKGGLSPQTVRRMERLLHKAFGDAVRHGVIVTNPVAYTERPRVERRPKRALEDSELEKLLDAADRVSLYTPLFVILSTGLRRGELLALKWRNIDLDHAVLFVTETVEETKAGLRVKHVKTSAGRRRVELPKSTVDVLRTHQVQQRKNALPIGEKWSVDRLLFPGADGGLQRPRNFTKAISGFAKRLGIEGFSPHAGRHEHLTRLLRDGIHPKVAQLRAGHSSVQVPLDVYSHVTDALQREAAERIEHTFRGLVKK
jgi:integrase